LLIGAGASLVALLGLWIGLHKIPWLGPMFADGLRSVIGVKAVSNLQEAAYGAQDRVFRTLRDDERPKAYWPVPPQPAEPRAPTVVSPTCEVPPFRPKNIGPVHESWSAPGDGVWVPIEDQRRTGDAPILYKTLLHPDQNRSWAAVSIVAIDRRRAELHMVAGRYEPRGQTKEARDYERKAVISSEHQRVLLAAFNGGFKTEHGHYGMKVDNVTIVKPRSLACWIGKFADGELVIGDWSKLAEREKDAVWWRQTPGCMLERGELHPGLRSEKNTYWGATLAGDTVIRRSAIGLSDDGTVLFSGIGDHTTARAIALALRHAGAAHVAQLDVNWSYPKFVIYQPRDGQHGELVATKLCDGFEFSEDQYIREPATRDFFYLTRRDDDLVAKRVCDAG